VVPHFEKWNFVFFAVLYLKKMDEEVRFLPSQYRLSPLSKVQFCQSRTQPLHRCASRNAVHLHAALVEHSRQGLVLARSSCHDAIALPFRGNACFPDFLMMQWPISQGIGFSCAWSWHFVRMVAPAPQARIEWFRYFIRYVLAHRYVSCHQGQSSGHYGH